ncbi:MAG: type III-B CRISPR module RAMP protein Cmr4, partial [Candidatus Bathyarchaeia archaeon]
RYEAASLLAFWCETPLHIGSATRGVGTLVDLPIQRETFDEEIPTEFPGLPMVQASSVKGVLRSFTRERLGSRENMVERFFGSELGGRKPTKPARLLFTDLRLLLFPVQAQRGLFVWVTSPLLLARLSWALELLEVKAPLNRVKKVAKGDALVAAGCGCIIEIDGQPRLPLTRDCVLRGKEDEDVAKWSEWIRDNLVGEDPYIKTTLSRKMIVVDDKTMRRLATYHTEVVTRIRLEEERKVVETGGLWTEEYLPSQTLLYGLLSSTDKDDLLFFENLLTERGAFILGGDETIGRGLVRLVIFPQRREEG